MEEDKEIPRYGMCDATHWKGKFVFFISWVMCMTKILDLIHLFFNMI